MKVVRVLVIEGTNEFVFNTMNRRMVKEQLNLDVGTITETVFGWKKPVSEKSDVLLGIMAKVLCEKLGGDEANAIVDEMYQLFEEVGNA